MFIVADKVRDILYVALTVNRELVVEPVAVMGAMATGNCSPKVVKLTDQHICTSIMKIS